MKKLLVFGIILSLLFPTVYADDLELTIAADEVLEKDIKLEYKFAVKNLDGTADNRINFSLEYWISDTSDFLSRYPRTTSGSLKRSKTIKREWTPKQSGEFSICGKILNSTTDDPDSDNNFICKEIFVEGEIEEEEVEPEKETNEKEEATKSTEAQEQSSEPQTSEGGSTEPIKKEADEEIPEDFEYITGEVIWDSDSKGLSVVAILFVAVLMILVIALIWSK